MICQLRGVLAASAVVVAALQMGCGSEQRPVGTTMTTGARWVPIGDATDKLSAGVCEREVRCNDVGQGRKFSDYDGCVSQYHRNTQQSLEAAGCSRAIDDGELDTCLRAIQDERCDRPLDTVGRLKACRAEALCVRLQRGSLGG